MQGGGDFLQREFGLNPDSTVLILISRAEGFVNPFTHLAETKPWAELWAQMGNRQDYVCARFVNLLRIFTYLQVRFANSESHLALHVPSFSLLPPTKPCTVSRCLMMMSCFMSRDGPLSERAPWHLPNALQFSSASIHGRDYH